MSDTAWIGTIVGGIVTLSIVFGVVWGLRSDRTGYQEASFDGEFVGTLVEVAADIVTALLENHH